MPHAKKTSNCGWHPSMLRSATLNGCDEYALILTISLLHFPIKIERFTERWSIGGSTFRNERRMESCERPSSISGNSRITGHVRRPIRLSSTIFQLTIFIVCIIERPRFCLRTASCYPLALLVARPGAHVPFLFLNGNLNDNPTTNATPSLCPLAPNLI